MLDKSSEAGGSGKEGEQTSEFVRAQGLNGRKPNGNGAAPPNPDALHILPAAAPFIEHVLFWARFGWPVFPVDPTTKKPRTKHGFKDATTDVQKIRRWWRDNPNSMIGIPT